MEVEHLGLGREDRMFIPTPLAHQTGFLYGMWLSLVLGSTQVLQDVWDPKLAAAALRRWEGTFVQAATPFLADLVRVVEEGEEPPPALRFFVVTGAAVPRALAARATETLSAAVCGAWGSTESCLAALADPSDDPERVWGTDGRALAGTELRVTGDDGAVLGPGEEGNFEVPQPLPVRRLPRPARPDRGGVHARRLVPHRRPGDDRRRRVPADHRAGQGRDQPRRREGAGGRGRAAAARTPAGRGRRRRRDARRAPRRARLRLRRRRRRRRGASTWRRCAGTSTAAALTRHYWPERVELIDAMPRTPSGKIQKFVLRELAGSLRAESPKQTEKEPTT